MYEALQLACEGRGADLIRSGQWKTNQNGGQMCVLGGRWVVNPSGGLESKGHPIGATGWYLLAYETCSKKNMS